MAIRQLSLTDFRNLGSATLDFDSRLNMVYGVNGAGKTSMLEAIFVLCQAHSFRTHQLKQCVRHGKDGFLLFGRFDDFKAGLAKRDKKLEIHVNGENIKRRSELVRRAPINIVNADSFAIIDGAPQKRRAYLDWCLFHVEHEYAENWSKVQHALKQRNRLLKSRHDLGLLDYWDRHLLEPSAKLKSMREEYCRRLQRQFDSELQDILNGIPLELAYRPGWPSELDLESAMERQRERDIRLGFTGIGVHRDDLLLTTEGRPVGEVLSRGQSKRLCLAMLLAVLGLVESARSGGVILLIDDLHSELDPEAQYLVYTQLEKLNLQLFISNIDGAISPALGAKEFKMFHVEHGTIKPRIFS